jgi:hypothetical protein
MNRYNVTIRYITPSGGRSEYTESYVYARSPWEALQSAKDTLRQDTPRRKVKALTSASCELCEC